ncbi:MAG: helix-turn-helix transcriptional regulator [Bacteroidaceae bacterium]|nr:helix-turn-helix transcriptional regulator [Bacteroidaceae bacterium]
MGRRSRCVPSPLFTPICTYEIENYLLCEVYGTNTSYLSGTVNRYFGCNLKTVVNSYRVEYAKELLRSRQYSIRDIPRLCGFSSRSAFYAAFQRIAGASPLSYMKQCRSKNEQTEQITIKTEMKQKQKVDSSTDRKINSIF